jgi:hypothetical protein
MPVSAVTSARVWRAGRHFCVALLLVTRAAGGAVLTVNDAADPGILGDGSLSLSEAVRLATGDLPCPGSTASCAGLSAGERAQVAGDTPGPAVADTIRFGVPRVALAGNGTAEALPPLDAGGDTIDGEGATVVDGAALNAAVLWGIRITSTGNTIRGVAFDDVPGTVVHVTPPAGGTLRDTRITGNRFTRAGIDAIRLVAAALPAVDATVVGGLLDGTAIESNTIEVATPGNLVRGFRSGAINVIAGYAPARGTVSGARISGTLIAGNTIRDVFQGVFARAAAGSGTLTGNLVDGLTVRDNVFERVNDQTLYVGASNIGGGGAGSDNAVRDVAIVRNVFRTRVYDPAAPFLGGGPFVSGGFLDGCADETSTPTSLRDRIENVLISDNDVVDRGPYGLMLQGAQSCGGAGGSLHESALVGVRVTANRIAGSDTGISMAGASSFRTGGPLSNAGNALRAVEIDHNVLTGNAIVGVEVIGAVSGGAGQHRGGDASGNAVVDLRVHDNAITDNGSGVAVTGAVIAGTVNAVRENVVSGLVLASNTITGTARMGVMMQGAAVSDGGTATKNRVEAPAILDNGFHDIRGVAVILLPATPAPGARATANGVYAPLLARNTMDAVAPGQPGDPKGVGILIVAKPGNEVATATLEANTIVSSSTGIWLAKSNGHVVRANEVTAAVKKIFRGNRRRNTVVDNTFVRAPRR